LVTHCQVPQQTKSLLLTDLSRKALHGRDGHEKGALSNSGGHCDLVAVINTIRVFTRVERILSLNEKWWIPQVEQLLLKLHLDSTKYLRAGFQGKMIDLKFEMTRIVE
jgi:hypothetical protein